MPLPSNNIFTGADGNFIAPNEFYVANLSSISFEVNGEVFNLKGIGLLLTKSMPASTVKNLKALMTRYFTNFVKSPMGRDMFKGLTTELSDAMQQTGAGNNVKRWAFYFSERPIQENNSAIFETDPDVYTVYSINTSHAIESGEFEGVPGIPRASFQSYGNTALMDTTSRAGATWTERSDDMSYLFGPGADNIKLSQTVMLTHDEVQDRPAFRDTFTHETVHAYDNAIRYKKPAGTGLDYEKFTQSRAMQIEREADPTAAVFPRYGRSSVEIPQGFAYNSEGRVVLLEYHSDRLGRTATHSVNDSTYQRLLNGRSSLSDSEMNVIDNYFILKDEVNANVKDIDTFLENSFKAMKEKYGLIGQAHYDEDGKPVINFFSKDNKPLTDEEATDIIKAQGGDESYIKKFRGSSTLRLKVLRLGANKKKLAGLTDNNEILQKLSAEVQNSPPESTSFNPPLEESSTVCSGP